MIEDLTRILRARLQARGDGDLAPALSNQDAYDRLPQGRKAVLDVAIFGTGYTVDGKRVDPTKVEVFIDG